jgi:hypothetical protein
MSPPTFGVLLGCSAYAIAIGMIRRCERHEMAWEREQRTIEMLQIAGIPTKSRRARAKKSLHDCVDHLFQIPGIPLRLVVGFVGVVLWSVAIHRLELSPAEANRFAVAALATGPILFLSIFPVGVLNLVLRSRRLDDYLTGWNLAAMLSWPWVCFMSALWGITSAAVLLPEDILVAGVTGISSTAMLAFNLSCWNELF